CAPSSSALSLRDALPIFGVAVAVVFEPADVEVVAAFGNCLACELAEAAFFALVFAFGFAVGVGAETLFEVAEVGFGERCAFANRDRKSTRSELQSRENLV